MAAMLLPFNADGTIAADAYQTCLKETIDAGLTPAVNMDTGYVNLLTEHREERTGPKTRPKRPPGAPPSSWRLYPRAKRRRLLVDLYRAQMDRDRRPTAEPRSSFKAPEPTP